MKTPKCPDCKTAMESGWLPDATYGGIAPSFWASGKPSVQYMFFAFPGSAGMRVKGGRVMPIEAWRCPDCGLVRNYAFPRKWNKVE